MKLKIGMMYDQKVPFGREVSRINHDWAWKQQYAFTCQEVLPNPQLDPYWNRIPFIRQNLTDCDWFVWLDADVIIVNQERRLEPDLPKHQQLAFSTDYNGLCCGAFAVRNSDWSRSLLDAWLFLGPVGEHAWHVFDERFMREQTTLKALRRTFPSVESEIGFIPEHVIQNICSAHAPDALAFHCWAGYIGNKGVERVLARLKDGGYRPGIAL